MSEQQQSPDAWQFFKGIEERIEGNEASATDDARHAGDVMLATFSTDAGREALRMLREATIDKPSLPDIGAERMLYEPQVFTAYAIWCEAQKDLVRKIEKLIALASTPR